MRFTVFCFPFGKFYFSFVHCLIGIALCLGCRAAADAQCVSLALLSKAGSLQKSAVFHHHVSAEAEATRLAPGIVTLKPHRSLHTQLIRVQLPEADVEASAQLNADESAEDTGAKIEIEAEPHRTGKGRVLIGRPISEIPVPAPSLSAQFGERGGFQWQRAIGQSVKFLGIQHAFRMATEDGTRRELVKGAFFREWFRSARNLRGWDDGDPFIVNYIGHPMMGAVTGFIQIQNDPRGITQEIRRDKAYWKSRLKAMGWSVLYSTQFELGPVSESSIGNIGLRPYGKAKNPQAWVDLVVTPVVGTAWLVGEDALDKYLVRSLENRTQNRTVKALVRSFLNPSRSFANMLRGKWFWHRDDR